jgi:SpoVK/Ycf46/Vps4 family AAA+-type ATPase
LALHYGEDFSAWKAQFIRALKSHVSGASILEGEPGTGKTTFIRHLIHQLRRTHRFYYLPANQLELLSAPNLVQFWIRESHDAERLAKVIVVEDAEPLLMPRARDNHDQLSNFLNIADGLPGEFLKLHLVCTINCKIDKLDPAVTRTGRLIAYRNFRRLNRAEASRLALAKNLTIPVQESYLLAEIYNERRSGFEEAKTMRVGFG